MCSWPPSPSRSPLDPADVLNHPHLVYVYGNPAVTSVSFCATLAKTYGAPGFALAYQFYCFLVMDVGGAIAAASSTSDLCTKPCLSWPLPETCGGNGSPQPDQVFDLYMLGNCGECARAAREGAARHRACGHRGSWGLAGT